MSDFVNRQIDALVHAAEPMLGSLSREKILGPELAKLVGPLMSQNDVPVTAVPRLARQYPVTSCSASTNTSSRGRLA